MIDFFHSLPHSIARSFTGKRLYFHIFAILLTALIVLSGFDWHYYLLTRHAEVWRFAMPAVFLGLVIPVIGPLLILWWGHIKKKRTTIALGWALGQAAFVGWLVSVCYKALTGRMPPNLHGSLVDISRGFHFGLWKAGIFWGWPSSHTTVAFAVSVAFLRLRPKYRILGFLALVYALYIGLGVSVTVHWFSEFAAGALIGTAVGLSVAANYGKRRAD